MQLFHPPLLKPIKVRHRPVFPIFQICFQPISPNTPSKPVRSVSAPASSKCRIRIQCMIYRIQNTPSINAFLKIRNVSLFDYYVLSENVDLLNEIGGERIFEKGRPNDACNFIQIKSISRRFKNLFHKLIDPMHVAYTITLWNCSKPLYGIVQPLYPYVISDYDSLRNL